MADEVENDNPTTEDTPAEDTPTEDTPTEDTPDAPEDTPADEPNYAALIDDLTERLNGLAEQVEIQAQTIAALREENADLVENIAVIPDDTNVTDSHSTGDDFYDELFN